MAILKKTYTITEVIDLWRSKEKLEIPLDILEGIQASCRFLYDYLANQDKPVYGVNTGFGAMQNVAIPEHELHELQKNLLITHAAGTGNILPIESVRLMMFLKIINISKGYSSVSELVLNHLLFFYNQGITPEVHEQGSLGASGDLAPLAEMCLPLIGLGRVYHADTGWLETIEAEIKFGFVPLVLGPKEALALINGTQFMLMHAVQVAEGIAKIKTRITQISSISLDVFLCRKDPFHEALHRVRPHAGQIEVAAEISALLADSHMQTLSRPAVQDPYSFRCIPQVHGASLDAFKHCIGVWETELNSVTDNPIAFMEEDLILSGGNFHGQPLALTLDYAAMALAELGSISERRTYLLVSGQRGLPPFLASKPGTDSGYMIAQYTAASIVSKNKQLCTPASVDSIVSSNGQEDHVSMGANAAVKALQVLENVKTILSIEFLCGTQAFNLRDSHIAPSIEALFEHMQLVTDEHMYEPMNRLIARSRELMFENQ